MPVQQRPPVLMMTLHIWALSHGIASLFGRGDAARRPFPMSPEDLWEAPGLIHLNGLGLVACAIGYGQIGEALGTALVPGGGNCKQRCTILATNAFAICSADK